MLEKLISILSSNKFNLSNEKETQSQIEGEFLKSGIRSDPLIIDLLGIKASQSHSIMNPLAAIEKKYSDESRLKLLAEKFLEKKKNSGEFV